jgi:uncharacterized protein
MENPIALTTQATRSNQSENKRFTLDTLEVIIKAVERCNLACPYCYYFYKGEDSWRTRPSFLKPNLIEDIVLYLREAVETLAIKNLLIVFHGGEPTLQRPEDCNKMCEMLKQHIKPPTQLSLGIQTNGVEMSDEWIKLIVRHQISISISIDGPASVHDTYRVNHKGEGSFARIKNTLSKLQAHREDGYKHSIAALSVLNPMVTARQLIETVVDELNIKSIGLLLPDCSWDSPTESIQIYGKIFCDIYDIWLERDRNFHVREIENVLRFYQASTSSPFVNTDSKIDKEECNINNEIILIHSNGDVTFDCSLIPALEWYKSLPTWNIHQHPVAEVIRSKPFQQAKDARNTLPVECQECGWQKICQGGDLENRYSSANGFKNKSIYCEALGFFHKHIIESLLKQGYPSDLVAKKLFY